jgi:hypothetical protein
VLPLLLGIRSFRESPEFDSLSHNSRGFPNLFTGFFVVITNTPEKMAIKDNTSNTIGYNPLIRSTDTIYKFMFIEKKIIIW